MYQTTIAAERSVIGNIMMNSAAVVPEAALCLTKESFLSPMCGEMFAACCNMYYQNKPIDPLLVAQEIGGDDFVRDCVAMAEETPTVSNYKAYIRIVQDNAKRRAAQEKADQFLTALNAGDDMKALRTKATDIVSCFDDLSEREAVSAKDGFVKWFERIGREKSYLSTGFSNLDRQIFLDKGKFMVVGGRPSSGKTAITLQMALYMARKYRVVYFSLETSADCLFDRACVCYTGISYKRTMRRELSDEHMSLICEHTDSFSKLDFFVVEAAGWDTSQIRAKAIQLKADVIFVDYLTLVKSNERTQYERATQISVDLHTMAQKLKIAVVALAQLNRASKDEPDMSSFRDSGQIEQDADIILQLFQPDSDPAERVLRVAKCKEGTRGDLKLHFDGDKQTFFEVDSKLENIIA